MEKNKLLSIIAVIAGTTAGLLGLSLSTILINGNAETPILKIFLSNWTLLSIIEGVSIVYLSVFFLSEIPLIDNYAEKWYGFFVISTIFCLVILCHLTTKEVAYMHLGALIFYFGGVLQKISPKKSATVAHDERFSHQRVKDYPN